MHGPDPDAVAHERQQSPSSRRQASTWPGYHSLSRRTSTARLGLTYCTPGMRVRLRVYAGIYLPDHFSILVGWSGAAWPNGRRHFILKSGWSA